MYFTLVTVGMAQVTAQGTPSSPTTQPASPVLTTQPTSSEQGTLLTFQQNQQTLAKSLTALFAQNPTPQQMQAWQQQNATALANQQQLAQEMAANSAVQPMPTVGQPNIPANASPTLAAFLTTQATLANARAQIHNQLVSALPAEVSEEQISAMQQQEMQLFQQQQGANLQLQTQQAQTLANESASQPVPLPPPLVIPPGSSPQMAAFLTARDQLMRAQINFSNQYVTSTPAVRNAAMAQWMQQNAASFQQVQQLAQNLSTTTATTQN
ncbi:MAG: hypothetical protein LV480_02000 [Methylacidiphilales bacterium]|nr:hypothetical protein [Candidatus Methylacidiphilales bacterium]